MMKFGGNKMEGPPQMSPFRVGYNSNSIYEKI